MINRNQPAARLIWQAENGQQEIILYKGDEVTIGRGDGNTIVLSSARVSRNHARIEWNGTAFTVRDMNSSNGTFVNKGRVEHAPCVLRDGDLIVLESIPFHFELITRICHEENVYLSPANSIAHRDKVIPKPRLIIADGSQTGCVFLIDKEVITIGRESMHAKWEVQLMDGAVSRPHARIELYKEQYSITDLGSANGTFINESLVIAPVILNDKDVIRIGKTRLIFRLTEST